MMIRRHSTMTCAMALLITCAASEVCPAQTLAIRGQTVYTMAGPPIKDGAVLIRDGKIQAVGKAGEILAHAEGLRVLRAKVVTPAEHRGKLGEVKAATRFRRVVALVAMFL